MARDCPECGQQMAKYGSRRPAGQRQKCINPDCDYDKDDYWKRKRRNRETHYTCPSCDCIGVPYKSPRTGKRRCTTDSCNVDVYRLRLPKLSRLRHSRVVRYEDGTSPPGQPRY